MDTSEPGDIIHPSLLEPVLIAGVERRVLGLEFLLAVGLFAWKGLALTSLLLVVLVVAPLHLASLRMARVDPRMLDILLRHLRWRQYYPARASYRAAHPPVLPSIPGAR